MRSIRHFVACATTSFFVATSVAQAQQVVTRPEAIDAALTRGARLAIARADTAGANARLVTARAWQNPNLATSYSKSVPQIHITLELPIDLPGVRSSRIAAAQASQRAASFRFQFERAAIVLDADTTFTRAQSALAHARLSRRNAADADSLLRMAVARRNAGDAAELDVQLANVNAGQQANVAIADSIAAILALDELRTVMGIPATGAPLLLADSFAIQPFDSAQAFAGTPLPIAAATASLTAAEIGLRLQRRSVLGSPSLMAGFETHDPTGGEKGILPTFGISLPLPFLNRNNGPIAEATAERSRARAELELARLESTAQITRAFRERNAAFARVARDQALVASANRVAAMSLTAYRAGAASLPNVFEAQRNAREVLAQYIDDVAAALVASSTVRLLTLTTSSP